MTILTERSGVRFRDTDESTAAAPPEVRGTARDDVRLLVARTGDLSHHRFADLADVLEPGDVVVVNNSATVSGEIDARRGAEPIVLHAATRLDDGTWVVELRTAPDASHPILDGNAGETIGVGRAAGDAGVAVPARRVIARPGRATGSGAPTSRVTCVHC